MTRFFIMYALSLCMFTILQSCVTTKHAAQKSTVIVSEEIGLITIRANEYGDKVDDAIAKAKILAIKTILFRGLPTSNQLRTPMIGVDEVKIMKSNSKYFNEFFDNARYESFIISAVVVSDFKKDISNKKAITVDIKINIRALRNDLEVNSILRKFGL